MKVILLMAVTADGKIARDSMDQVNWTGKSDKQYFVKVTRKAGVMVMGSKTFDTIGRVLPHRKNIVLTRDKSRQSSDDNLIFTDQAPETVIKDLQDQGYTSVALIGGSVINTAFIKDRLIDEIHMTIVPKLFGTGLSLFNQSLDMDLLLMDVIKLDQGHVLLKYKVTQ